MFTFFHHDHKSIFNTSSSFCTNTENSLAETLAPLRPTFMNVLVLAFSIPEGEFEKKKVKSYLVNQCTLCCRNFILYPS